MKTNIASFVARTVALAMALAVGIVVSNTAMAAPKKGPSTGSPNAVAMLDQAYGLLRIADHDYKGHRVHAMHDIEAAARELGTSLSGGGKGKEAQGTSDEQLKQAQSLLGQAVGGLTGKAHHHVEVALNQLNIALKIK
jgi:hypothetical protein